jgi:dihydroflavonol-4-reductase
MRTCAVVLTALPLCCCLGAETSVGTGGEAVSASELVCVTGGTGYVASVLLKALLADPRALRVRATVREGTMARGAGSAWAQDALWKHERLELRRADLLDAAAMEAALRGCSVVHHTASPFPAAVPPGMEEMLLLAPALDGTQNVLRAARRGGARRVVVTSSTAAVTAQHPPLDNGGRNAAGAKWSEGDWNVDSQVHEGAYRYSKVLAEQAAWRFAAAEGGAHEPLPAGAEHGIARGPGSEGAGAGGEPAPAFSVVALNPSFVMGPPVIARAAGTSVGLVKGMLDGVFSAGGSAGALPGGACYGTVDVRDLAAAHIAAMDVAAAAGQRFVLSSERCSTQLELAGAIKAEAAFAGWPLPTEEAKPHATRAVYDAGRARRVLGIKLRPIQATLRDMALAMRDMGMAGPAQHVEL